MSKRELYRNNFFGQPVLQLKDYVEVSIENAIPRQNELEKKRHCCGIFKFLARRRSRVVTSLTIFCSTAIIVFLLLIGVFLFIGVGTVANGITYNGPQRMPWMSQQQYHEYARNLGGKTVILENSVVVHRVIEPEAQMSTVNHVLLLISSLKESKLAGMSSINEVSIDDIKRGYLPWRPVEMLSRFNFTLQRMKQTLRSAHKDDTCVCYKSYGIPYDIVYLVQDDIVAYQPVVMKESTDRVNVTRDCNIYKLIRQAKRIDDWNKDETFESARSGRVHYLTESGLHKRTMIGWPQFPCIQHCLNLFTE